MYRMGMRNRSEYDRSARFALRGHQTHCNSSDVGIWPWNCLKDIISHKYKPNKCYLMLSATCVWDQPPVTLADKVIDNIFLQRIRCHVNISAVMQQALNYWHSHSIQFNTAVLLFTAVTPVMITLVSLNSLLYVKHTFAVRSVLDFRHLSMKWSSSESAITSQHVHQVFQT
jgi:hypothetical protein